VFPSRFCYAAQLHLLYSTAKRTHVYSIAQQSITTSLKIISW